MNYTRELEISKKAAVLAGGAIMEVYGAEDFADGFKVEYKEDNSPLTEADRRANDIIVNILKKEFPEYAILAEESADDKKRLENDYCFIVDPLDGTKEFIKRNGQFTVNIALAYKHKPVMGVIYVPVTRELYYAAAGGGSWYKADGGSCYAAGGGHWHEADGDSWHEAGGHAPVKLKVSDKTDELTMVMSSSHGCARTDELIKKRNIKNHIKMGSSLKGCLIAKGDAEVYYRLGPTMEWDTAAMQCIAEQAGAIFRQTDGTEMLYNRENSLNDKGFFILNRMENRLF